MKLAKKVARIYALNCIPVIGQDGSILNFMCLAMIDPATGWFEMVELPVIEIFKIDDDDVKMSKTFDKISLQIAKLVNTSGFSRYLRPRYAIYDNVSKFKLHFHYLC